MFYVGVSFNRGDFCGMFILRAFVVHEAILVLEADCLIRVSIAKAIACGLR